MNHKILGLSGVKRSGKTTCVNFLHGYEMARNDVIKNFELNDRGELLVNAIFTDERGEETEGMGVFDVHRTDDDFANYASQRVWPYVKAYNFADSLKSVAMTLFGLTREQCYGTGSQKNEKVAIKKPGSNKKFTARQFLQHFGTDMCRSLKPDIWTSYLIRHISAEQVGLALIGDCRFPNEVNAIHEAGGKVIRLTRRVNKDKHESETALDNFKEFDGIIDNSELTVDEQCKKLIDILGEWGWLSSELK